MSERRNSLSGLNPERQSPDTNASDRLESWKEIAAYLKRDLRTVQRWEKTEGLPVHRHRHDERSSVFASKSELDTWWHNEYLQLEVEEKASPSRPSAIEPVEVAAPAAAKTFLRNRWKLVAATAIVIAAAATLILARFMRPTPALSGRDTIVIAGFSNSTGDAVFDVPLRQGLIVELEQSPFLSLVSDERIRKTLQLMERPVDTKVAPEIARELCQRIGGKAYISGSITRLGNDYVVGLDAVNCATGDSLAQEQAQAMGKERVIEALGTAATGLRTKLGESLGTVRTLDTPLPQATTSSLEGLRAFSLALRAPDADAIPLLQHAIALDPDFAIAYDALGRVQSNLGESEAGSDNIRKAFALRGRTSEREQFRISEDYYAIVTGQVEKGLEISRLWAQTYPRDPSPYATMGAEYMWLGQYDNAVRSMRTLSAYESSQAAYANLEESYLALNRLDDAQRAVDSARLRWPGNGSFIQYELAFLRGDGAAMEKELALAGGSAQDPEVMALTHADTEAYYGHAKASFNLGRQAVLSALGRGRKESASLWLLDQALPAAEIGLSRQAVMDAIASLRISETPDVRVVAALVLARAGDVNRAEPLTDSIDKQFPSDSVMRTYWNSSALAAIALKRDNPNLALRFLDTASPVELSGWTIWPDATTMYPVYLRGEAYLALHKATQAAMEFQNILDHRGLILNSPFGALARLQLGRAYAMKAQSEQGEEKQAALAKARAAYQDFLKLWKDADPDIPLLKEAKAEYAKLH